MRNSKLREYYKQMQVNESYILGEESSLGLLDHIYVKGYSGGGDWNGWSMKVLKRHM